MFLTQLPEQKGGPQPFCEQHVVGRELKATRLNSCLGQKCPKLSLWGNRAMHLELTGSSVLHRDIRLQS